MLLNLMLWAKGLPLNAAYLTTDPGTECAWFPDARQLVVINNTDTPRTTAVHTPEGDVTVELEPFATCILDR